MATTFVFDIKGMTQAQYDDVIRELQDRGLTHPRGRITHVACTQPDGWFVVDTWESEAEFAEFGATLLPLLAARGIQVEPRAYAVHNQVINPRVAAG